MYQPNVFLCWMLLHEQRGKGCPEITPCSWRRHGTVREKHGETAICNLAIAMYINRVRMYSSEKLQHKITELPTELNNITLKMVFCSEKTLDSLWNACLRIIMKIYIAVNLKAVSHRNKWNMRTSLLTFQIENEQSVHKLIGMEEEFYLLGNINQIKHIFIVFAFQTKIKHNSKHYWSKVSILLYMYLRSTLALTHLLN